MEMILEFMAGHPKLSAVLMVLGVFRAIFKPAMLLLETYVKSTPSEKDDKWLVDVKESKVYQFLVWLVDYLTSIKLPKKHE